MRFYADTNLSGNELRIETDGGIVNIQVGLTDAEGHQVTSIQVIPSRDEYGRYWVKADDRLIRVKARDDPRKGCLWVTTLYVPD
ncbi:MAG TPA: hypothetical protein VF060_13785 [Trebonia sp.]